MGVTIYKAGEPNPYAGLSHAERRLKERQERAARMAEHRARQDAFMEGKALGGAPENKALPGPPEMKDLSGLTKDALVAVAAERGVTVTRADGRDDLDPTKADYLAALG